ncbi:MAG: hypothetical protein WC959_06650 [Kiritimatiellales bacterium]
MESWNNGILEHRKNINRGYMKLRVWQDAKELYKLTWKIMKPFPYKLKQQGKEWDDSFILRETNEIYEVCYEQ